MKFKLFALSFVLIGIAAGFLAFQYYGFFFARTVTGEIVAVERLTQPSAIIAGSAPTGGNPSAISTTQLFSFAVAVKDSKGGEIVTGSSEDRQWAIVQKGQCAEAKFFPYPPWNLEKAGTYYGTRLLKLFECSKKE